MRRWSKDVPLEYTVEQAQGNMKAALAPLGADYVAGLDTAFKDRWIDYYPTQGKQSGAYMNPGAYDVHPYLLLNFNGQYDGHVRRWRTSSGTRCTAGSPSKSQPYAHGELPDLRRRGRIDLQRGAAHRARC